MTHLRYNRKDLYLNGNEITGETYAARDFLKKQLRGTWNADRKSWTVNLDELAYWIEKHVVYVIEDQPEVAEVVSTKVNNGLCPRCGTYCYGDCQAH